MNYWHPETQKYYSERSAQKQLKILGLSPDNCEAQGLFLPVTDPKPTLTALQTARLKPLPELVNGVWTKVWEVTTITQAEADAQKEAQVQIDIKTASEATDADKAIARVLADIWRAQNPGMTVQEARAAVRNRLEFHLRDIKGL